MLVGISRGFAIFNKLEKFMLAAVHGPAEGSSGVGESGHGSSDSLMEGWETKMHDKMMVIATVASLAFDIEYIRKLYDC